MIANDLKNNIRKIISECIFSEVDKDKTKKLFEELMRDKEAWDKFLSIVVPDAAKQLRQVSGEDFEEFRKITLDEIDKWKPK